MKKDQAATKGGEGDRESDRRFRKSARKFVNSGKVVNAAKRAAIAQEDPAEKKKLLAAEMVGRSKSKGEEPEAVRAKKKKEPEGERKILR